jgi:hypothetical protein
MSSHSNCDRLCDIALSRTAPGGGHRPTGAAILASPQQAPLPAPGVQILAALTQASVIRAMLDALGLPTEPPFVHPARGPPEEVLRE